MSKQASCHNEMSQTSTVIAWLVLAVMIGGGMAAIWINVRPLFWVILTIGLISLSWYMLNRSVGRAIISIFTIHHSLPKGG